MSATKDFGETLRKLRRLRGLTQDDLARLCDRSVDAISQWERGVNWPSFDALTVLMKALEVSPLVFFPEHAKTETAERKDLRLEAELTLARLSDKSLAIAVDQLNALANRE